MSLHKLNFWPPAIILASEDMPPNMGGWANGIVIKIRQKYLNNGDKGLLQHELTHVWQFWMFVMFAVTLVFIAHVMNLPQLIMLAFPLCFGHSLLYAAVPAYRLWSEVQAYQVQAKFYPDDRLPMFAKFISQNYGLKISQAAALKLLQEK